VLETGTGTTSSSQSGQQTPQFSLNIMMLEMFEYLSYQNALENTEKLLEIEYINSIYKPFIRKEYLT